MRRVIVALAIMVLTGMISNAFCEEQPKLMLPVGHTGCINSIAVTADGRYGLTGSDDHTVKLWDNKTGNVLRTFFGHTGKVTSVSFSSGAKYALSGSEDKTVKVWDVETGREIKSFSIGDAGNLMLLSFSPDGRYAASQSWDQPVKLWDINTGETLQTFDVHAALIKSLCFSPDSKYILSSTADNTMKLWNTHSGQAIKTFSGFKDDVFSVSFSPDGKYALSGSYDNSITVWNSITGKKLKACSFDAGMDLVSFSPDSRYALIGFQDNTMKLWDIKNNKELQWFLRSDHEIDAVKSACFSPDGRFALLGCGDGSLRYLNIASHEEPITFSGHSLQVNSVALSNDGKYILSGVDSYNSPVRLWDIAAGKQIKTFSDQSGYGWVKSVSLSPNGKYALSGIVAGTITLWDRETGNALKNFSGQKDIIKSLCFSPDGNYALSSAGSFDTTFKLWNIQSGKELKSYSGGHFGGNNSICFSPDGSYALAGSGDKTMQLWDILTGNQLKVFTGHAGEVTSVSFSPDGRYALSGSEDATMKLWDIQTGNELKTFSGHTGSIVSVSFSPDGNYALSGSADNTMKLWDIVTGDEIKTFPGHGNEVLFASFLPDGKHIVSGSQDHTIKLWDSNSGNELCSMISVDSSDWVVTTPDGRFDGSENGMKMLYYVKGFDIIPLDNMFEKFYTPGLLARVMAGEKFEAPDVNIVSLQSPPVVNIVSPADGATINGQTVTITVTATDKGGGIDEISLYQNGKLVETEQRGLKALQQTGNRITKTFTVDLLNGENKFKATAFNRQRTEANPAEITIVYNGSTATSTLYVLAIGINQYTNNKLTLNYARPDAESFVQVMSANNGKLFKNIRVIPLYDSAATKNNVLASLDAIASKAGTGDVFVLYYAGHGSMTDNRFYFVTSNNVRLYERDALDQNAIYVKDMQDKLMAIKALKQVVIIDACQSGGAVEVLAFRGNTEEKAWAQLARSAGVHVLASTGTEQYANEFEKLGHGVFTYALLQGLEGKADGAPKDGKVTVKELSSYLDDQVPQLTKEYKGESQYPNTFSKGQDFPLIINNQ